MYIDRTAGIINFIENQYSGLVRWQTELFGMLKVPMLKKKKKRQKEIIAQIEEQQGRLELHVNWLKDRVTQLTNTFDSLQLDTVSFPPETYSAYN